MDRFFGEGRLVKDNLKNYFRGIIPRVYTKKPCLLNRQIDWLHGWARDLGVTNNKLTENIHFILVVNRDTDGLGLDLHLTD